jgi:signal transduction histidine kinase
MPPLDPTTLSLMIGLGNLVFALLATLYLRTLPQGHAPLALWRWGKACVALGFVVNTAQTFAPALVPVLLGNMLQLLGLAIELAAYSRLLGQPRWRRPIAAYVAVMLLLFQASVWLGASEHQRLMLTSLATALLCAAMAAVLLRARGGGLLARVIAAADASLALILLARVGSGLWLAPLARHAGDPMTGVLFISAFLTMLINGVGFLLLAKQDADRQLRQTLADLAQAEADQRALLSLASHEFRTPAARIQTSLDSLGILAARIPPEVTARLTNIRQAAARLTDLANTLITQDRLAERCLTPQSAPCELGALLGALVADYPTEQLGFEHPSAPLWLHLDPTLVGIAVRNLIDNALEHQPAQAGPVWVRLGSDAHGLRVEVADRGPGIPEAERARVFRRFHGRHGDLARGLGLAIVRAVAEAHGGAVSLEDHPGGGSRFVLHLPRLGR